MARDVAQVLPSEVGSKETLDPEITGTHLGLTAERLNRALSGRVLAVGGLWPRPRLGDHSITVTDVSADRLAAYRGLNVDLEICDPRNLPFANQSFDTVVFPLILHRITDGSARRARHNVVRALCEARRVVRPGGHVWVREWLVSDALYAAQRLLAPLTRATLGLLGLPLMIVHSEHFYRQAFARAGLGELEVERLKPPADKPTDLLHPIAAARFVVVPRFAVPAQPALLSARRAE